MEIQNMRHQPWYHGKISRDEASKLLQDFGLVEGSYLLRDSTTGTSGYAISIIHNGSILHYLVQRHPDGKYGIESGPRFSTPIDLIEHHKHHTDGLVSKLTVPCNRSTLRPSSTYVFNQAVEEVINNTIQNLGLQNDSDLEEKLRATICKTLHKKEQWYHGVISRDVAERRLRENGAQNGLFLVRDSQPPGSFAIGVCFRGSVYHYLLQIDAQTDRISINKGPTFSSVFEAVDYYKTNADGLLCLLGVPCSQSRNTEGNISDQGRGTVCPIPQQDRGTACPIPQQVRGTVCPIPQQDRGTVCPIPQQDRGTVCPIPWPGSIPENDSRPQGSDHIDNGASASHGIYDLQRMPGFNNCFKGIKEVDFQSLRLDNKVIGSGNFGSVLQGIYKKPNGDELPVAVKSLKTSEISAYQKSELMKEARMMTGMDHVNIVRMCGLCQNPQGATLLVMELAAEGPLHKYLKKHRSMPLVDVLIMMLQVSEGMAYLSANNFIHRDLAARNVLVVNENFVKISDFGLSTAMGAGEDYYKADKYGKWPLKWYAPECIYFRKFSPKTDVWSYGITLYEAVTYGGKPYEGMNGQVFIGKLEGGYRLECPPSCPKPVYDIMFSCWKWNAEDRPTFVQLGQKLAKFISAAKKAKK